MEKIIYYVSGMRKQYLFIEEIYQKNPKQYLGGDEIVSFYSLHYM